jgi:hypothetical protein
VNIFDAYIDLCVRMAGVMYRAQVRTLAWLEDLCR